MSKALSAYRSQQVATANPEQQAALLMEAGQVHIAKAIKAINEKDYTTMGNALCRVCDVINEAIFRLDFDNGGELADNLLKIYNWWVSEALTIAGTREIPRLVALSGYMGDIRQAWESKAKQNL